jgi:outer membrane protein TolC
LAGANNLQIALADERVRQAEARRQGAEVQWLPSLDLGVGYNNHAGRIQDTGGNIVDTRRSSVFVGGGPNLGPAALTGGDGSSRLVVGAPLADLLFTPLAERQAVRAADASRAATFNDTLLQVGLAYLDLLRAQEQVAVARETVANAEEFERLVSSRVRAGTIPPADGLRARAELADRRRQELQAREAVADASAELVRLLRLDPAVGLFSLDAQPVPIDLVDVNIPLPDLLSQGLTNRPELAQYQALVEAALARLKQEQWRPLIPAVQLGYSAGDYGGGKGSFFGDFGGRGDFDALLVWELRNLGLGNRALRRERDSQLRQAELTGEQVRDAVAAEVARAYHEVQFRRGEIEAARAQVEAAAEALPLNFKGVREGTLRAIEAQQAVQALAASRGQYLAAVIDYDRAQFQLLRAIGRPLDALGRDCDPAGGW